MRYSDDTRRPVTGVRRVGSSARPWTQRDMSSFPVVVRDPLGQDAPETLAPAVPMKHSQCPFACGARTGVNSASSDIERRGVVHSWCEAAIAVVNDEPMRGGY